MTSSNTMTEVAAPTLAQPTRIQQPTPTTSPVTSTEPHRLLADWPILIMIVCSCLLAGAFANYVLVPAARTATAASTHQQVDSGP